MYPWKPSKAGARTRMTCALRGYAPCATTAGLCLRLHWRGARACTSLVRMTDTPPIEHVDVLIVGAGLSGIGAACHLRTHCPGKTYAILEARSRLGGTWDLFRYPGVRSDSDMATLGYSFRPWKKAQSIAKGSAILSYLRETARDYAVDREIRYGHRVERAAWSSADAAWTVEVAADDSGHGQLFRCNFLYMCSGYYDYAAGYTPEFPGIDRFEGRVVHPQQWTPDIDYAGKRVVVIGSGATAVTLVPELAKTAAHVTMLQRSPTYVIAMPDVDVLANKLRRFLPPRAAAAVARWKSVLMSMFFFYVCKRWPDRMKAWLVHGVRMALGPDYDVGTHFTPRYKPWDQRVCLVANGDLFRSIRERRASVVTDHIDTFTSNGIRLRSGSELEADLIVTATGLNMRVLGGVQLVVDGASVDLAQALTYKGMMYGGVPNLAFAGGYTNASWTLKCDLTAEYACRLIGYMDALGMRKCMPRNRDASSAPQPTLNLSSGYVLRAQHMLPKQGPNVPWRLHQNYLRDLIALRYGRVDDGVMEFSRLSRAQAALSANSSLPPSRQERQDDQPGLHL
jgi:monooxygenase